jgi:AcrR family transcriptional regulator
MLHEQSTPRARRHDANLQRIIDAAMDMVAQGGLDSLSMNKLAAAVDYTPGALYRYFGSKDALLSKLVAMTLDDVRARLDSSEHRLADKASPLSRVFAIVHGYREFARREPHRFGLLVMTMADPRILLPEAEDAEPVALAIMATLQPLAAALADAVESKSLSAGDVAERTLCVFSSLHGALLLQKHARRVPDLIDVDRLAVAGVCALLIGWGAKPRALDSVIERVAAARRSGEST